MAEEPRALADGRALSLRVIARNGDVILSEAKDLYRSRRDDRCGGFVEGGADPSLRSGWQFGT
jgi:hypothetical protein